MNALWTRVGLPAMLGAALAGCIKQEKPPPTIPMIKARVWKGVAPEQIFSSILRAEVARGAIILNQSKEDGIINTDWSEFVQRTGRARLRSRASYVMTPIEGGAQLRMNLKLQVYQRDRWEEILEDEEPGTFAEWYKDNFEEVSRVLGKPFEGGTPAEKPSR